MVVVMKWKINKKFWFELVVAIMYMVSLEIIFRIVESYDIFSWTTVRIFLGSSLITILWNFLFFFHNNEKKQRVSNCILLLIATVYAFAQAGFLNFIGIYMSLGTSTQISAVTSYLKEFLGSFHAEYYLVWIPFFLYLFYMFVPNRKVWETENEVEKKQSRLQMLGVFFVFSLFYFFTLFLPFMQNPLQLISNLKLFHIPSNSSIAVNQFGPTMYGLLDVKHLLLPYQDEGIEEGNFHQEEVEENLARTFDDTLWKQLNESTKNSTYKNLNTYFMNRTITEKNEYTGYFKDKNVVVLMLESVNTVIENSKYFPNFSKMLEHGWYWKNHYSPRNSCATINNEMSGLTSLYTINNVCTANVYKENTYFQALFHQFTNAGYDASSYHDYDETYYSRHVIHKNMGSNEFFDVNDLNFPYDEYYAEWPNDADFMKEIIPLFANKKKFFTWITTVSAHQPYGEESELGDLYFDLFQDTEYTDSEKRYLSKVKVTDDALGVLLSELEKTNQLKDTVIVLYGDHYPYALSEDDLVGVLNEDILADVERDHTPFLIYNPQLEAQVFEQYTSYMNLAPTLANLFDLNYDPRFYFGEDLFSKNYSNRVVFSDGAWKDEIAYYNASKGKITYKGEETYSKEEIQKINTEITNKIRMSNLAITTNYFDYLEKGLKEQQKGENDD